MIPPSSYRWLLSAALLCSIGNALAQDSTPPHLVSAAANCSGGVIAVTFDKQMTDSALNPAHYALSGGLSVLSVSQPGNLETFYLTVSGALTQGQAYTVTVNGVSDLLGNPIAPSSQTSFSCT